MAQPKRRWSKQRTHLKRSTWKLEETNLKSNSTLSGVFSYLRSIYGRFKNII